MRGVLWWFVGRRAFFFFWSLSGFRLSVSVRFPVLRFSVSRYGTVQGVLCVCCTFFFLSDLSAMKPKPSNYVGCMLSVLASNPAPPQRTSISIEFQGESATANRREKNPIRGSSGPSPAHPTRYRLALTCIFNVEGPLGHNFGVLHEIISTAENLWGDAPPLPLCRTPHPHSNFHQVNLLRKWVNEHRDYIAKRGHLNVHTAEMFFS